MRLSNILLVPAVLLAAPVAAEHVKPREAPFELCMTRNLSAVTKDQRSTCDCARETWIDNNYGFDIELTRYMHFFETTGGDRAKAEALTAQYLSKDVIEIDEIVGFALGEMDRLAQACAA